MQTIFGKQPSETGVLPRFRVSTIPAPVNRNLPPVKLMSPRLCAGPPKPRTAGPGCARSLIEALAHSKVYQDYDKAFTEATGLPVALRPVESWQLPLHGKRHEAPYCALMSEKSRACASCLQMQEKLSRAASQEAHTMVCPAGLCETAVPVRLGDRLIGFLMTGQVFRTKPTPSQFDRTAGMVRHWGIEVDWQLMKAAYFATRVVPQKQQESAITLLRIFAQHLSMLSNQVMIRQENAEPPMITKAKAYIEEHQTEELSLSQVARAAATSTFYFCKMFRRITGINFTDYLARVRIEKSKNLLLNPNLRVSEIAYEVGFQSLTHFNRVFKKLLGQSPTDYRAHLMVAGHAA
jgi:AraC-like DNA-binding protein